VLIRLVSELSAHIFEDLAGWPIGCIRNVGFHGVDNLARDRSILAAQVASSFCSIVSLTSGPISLAQTAKNVAG
jgi:hypothetical protein